MSASASLELKMDDQWQLYPFAGSRSPPAIHPCSLTQAALGRSWRWVVRKIGATSTEE